MSAWLILWCALTRDAHGGRSEEHPMVRMHREAAARLSSIKFVMAKLGMPLPYTVRSEAEAKEAQSAMYRLRDSFPDPRAS